MFDAFLEYSAAIFSAFIFFVFLSATRNEYIRNQIGVRYIIAGFGLLLFSSILDITDNYPSLSAYIIIGDTEVEEFLEEAVGLTLGLLLIFRGVILWLPSIQELEETRQTLNSLTNELDNRVQQRSNELQQSNESLQKEVSERKKVEVELKHQILHDPLTAIPNRFALIEYLTNELSQEIDGEEEPFSALLFLDMDNFKQVNNLFGHAVGDTILTNIAHLLKSNFNAEKQFVARLGSDEFVLVFSALSRQHKKAKALANGYAQEIISLLKTPTIVDGQNIRVSASIGVKLFSQSENQTVYDLFNQADTALYHDGLMKKGGINFFQEEMQHQVVTRAMISKDLHTALDKQQFYLHYQPQVSSQGTLTGFESLIRWAHPDRGNIPPDDFISIAEDIGVIDRLGRYVLRQALSEFTAFLTHYQNERRLKLAVNISPTHFLQADFVSQVEEIMTQFDLTRCQLVLEVTECVVIQDIEDISEKMDQLHKLGVAISLDDFGTGYSSLSYIKRLPFDTLKIDRSFIRDITIDSNDAAIVEAILSMTQSLGVDVIAEGVETEEQRLFLEKRGCERHQGYLFGKPTLLREWLDSVTQQEVTPKNRYSRASAY